MHYLLSLSFDAENPGKPLGVALSGEVGGPPRQHEAGGGAWSFQHGDALAIAVSASAPVAANAQMKISSLVLAATRRGKKPGKRLSPFNKFDACAVVREWGLPQMINLRDIETVTTIPALHPLKITAKNGQWTLAGSLSILIAQQNAKARPRSYAFDLGIAAGA